MKCQILFSGKNKKNINLSSAELAQRVVKVKAVTKQQIIFLSGKIWLDILCESSNLKLYFS